MAEQLLDLPSWRLGTGDLFQNAGLLKWLHHDDPEMLKLITGFRVGYELYNRISSTNDVETYQVLCYSAIAEFVKKHPNASEKEIAKEVQTQVELFKSRIENL